MPYEDIDKEVTRKRTPREDFALPRRDRGLAKSEGAGVIVAWPPRGGGWTAIPHPRGGKLGYRRPAKLPDGTLGWEYTYPPDHHPHTGSKRHQAISAAHETEAGASAQIQDREPVQDHLYDYGTRLRHIDDDPNDEDSYEHVVVGQHKETGHPLVVTRRAFKRGDIAGAVPMAPEIVSVHPDDAERLGGVQPREPGLILPDGTKVRDEEPESVEGQPSPEKHPDVNMTDTEIDLAEINVFGLAGWLDTAGEVLPDAPPEVKSLFAEESINIIAIAIATLAGKSSRDQLNVEDQALHDAVSDEIHKILSADRDRKHKLIAVLDGKREIVTVPPPEPGEEPKQPIEELEPEEETIDLDEEDQAIVAAWKAAQEKLFAPGTEHESETLQKHRFKLPIPATGGYEWRGAPIEAVVIKLDPATGNPFPGYFKRVMTPHGALWEKYKLLGTGKLQRTGVMETLASKGPGKKDEEGKIIDRPTFKYRIVDPKDVPEQAEKVFKDRQAVADKLAETSQVIKLDGISFVVKKRATWDLQPGAEEDTGRFEYDIAYATDPKIGIGTIRKVSYKDSNGRYQYEWRVDKPAASAGFTNKYDQHDLHRGIRFQDLLDSVADGIHKLDGTVTEQRKVDISLAKDWKETKSFKPFAKTERELYPYQKHASVWLQQRQNGLLAYDTGNGKTLITINALAALKDSGKAKRGIIVAPKSVLLDWHDEILQSTTLKPVVVTGLTKVKRRRVYEAWKRGEYDVMLGTYEGFTRVAGKKVKEEEEEELTDDEEELTDDEENEGEGEAETEEELKKRLAKAPPNNDATFLRDEIGMEDVALFMDECQKIKSPGKLTNRSFGILTQNASHVFGLSATPQTNTPLDMFGVMNVVQPGLWESSQAFAKEYCHYSSYIDENGKEHTSIAGWKHGGGDQFRDDTAGYVMTATRSELGPEFALPPRIDDMPEVGLTDLQDFLIKEINRWPKRYGDVVLPYPTTDPKTNHEVKMKAFQQAMLEGGNAQPKGMHPYEVSQLKKRVESDPWEFLSPEHKKQAINGTISWSEKTEAIADGVFAHLVANNGPGPSCTDGAVIFTEFTANIEGMVVALGHRGVPPERIAVVVGSAGKLGADTMQGIKIATGLHDRKAVSDGLNRGLYDVVIASTKAANTGMNLQKRATGVFVQTLPHSLADHKQAIERVHRNGQKKAVYVYTPTVRHKNGQEGKDNKILRVHGIKRESATEALGSDALGGGFVITTDQRREIDRDDDYQPE